MFKKVIDNAGYHIEINTDLIAVKVDNRLMMSGGHTVDLSDESLAELNLILFPEKRTRNTEPKDDLNKLFDELHKLVGGKGKAIFTLNREKKLTELLTKHRMTKEDLVNAATNIGENEWLQGKNDKNTRYGDIDYLLRPDKAAKYAEEQKKKKKGMF